MCEELLRDLSDHLTIVLNCAFSSRPASRDLEAAALQCADIVRALQALVHPCVTVGAGAHSRDRVFL